MANVITIIESGNDGQLVAVDCHLSNSLPTIVIVGFAHRSVDEAKERIRGALASSGIPIPRKRIIISLAPADIPKEGSSFDLPMLVSILRSASMLKLTPDNKTIVLGEVGLDGSIRPIRGIIGKILAAMKHGMTDFWIPQANMAQASLVPGAVFYPFETVRQLYFELNQSLMPPPAHASVPLRETTVDHSITIDDIVGQEQAKRVLLIAAAGNHHSLLNGPPGTGKTMLARSLATIMPEMTQSERIDVTQLYSLASRDFDRIITDRPFRAPHHTASTSSILGGGQYPRPGEISLSHNGILFFDEFPEFSRSVIEALRQPLENQKITIARAKDTVDFPANFLLVATANPCPCGYYGMSKKCTCLPSHILHYQKKISGPIIDRIDLYLDVGSVPHHKLLTSHHSAVNQTQDYKKRVIAVRQLQVSRNGKLNSRLSNQELKQVANLHPKAEKILNHAAGGMKLSARGYIRTLRVARTIADLAASPDVGVVHISEALQYRRKS